MKNVTNNLDTPRSKPLVIFEYALLIFYLGIIILRVLYNEGPTMQTSSVALMASDSLYSMYVSGALLLSFIIWLVWNLFDKKFIYRTTGIGIGLFIFALAAVVSSFAAADKRMAINNIVLLISPVLCSILLVQILDSNVKIKLVLAVIAALGIVSAYQCVDQTLFINNETIKQYEENPDIMLESLNIQKDTLQQFLFEQRLHSNNARAFFTTRNSAGTFFLMAFLACVALLIVSEKTDFLKVSIAFIILAFVITKSKGAIIGLLFSLALICLYLKYHTQLKKQRKGILLLSVLLITIVTSAIVLYGINFQTLPGGISMLVRWQYWKASAQMFADHFWIGVGPGNFSYFYSYYKPAAALESVTDPHNFPLSILTQYGIFGFVGFLLMIFLPLWNTTKGNFQLVTQTNKVESDNKLKRTLTNIILCILFGSVLCKITLTEAFKSGNPMIIIYLFLRLCVPPIAIFSVSLYFIRKYTYKELNDERNVIRKSTFTVIIFCTLLGVLLHNLTDFAIFEPGIYTTFWFLFATLIAITARNKDKKQFVFTPAAYIKIPAVLGSVAICFVFLNYALIPVISSTKKIKLANESFVYGGLQQAHQLLDSAAKDDKLSEYALALQARMFVSNAERTHFQENELLSLAEDYLKLAIKRNKASYKNYEDLSQAYLKHSEVSPSDEKAGLLIFALGAAAKARDRYKGNERLHFNYAQIADKLDMTEKALQAYQKAVEIEDQYQMQFRKMYLKEKMVSRLGEDKYLFAKKRIAEITSENDI